MTETSVCVRASQMQLIELSLGFIEWGMTTNVDSNLSQLGGGDFPLIIRSQDYQPLLFTQIYIPEDNLLMFTQISGLQLMLAEMNAVSHL